MAGTAGRWCMTSAFDSFESTRLPLSAWLWERASLVFSLVDMLLRLKLQLWSPQTLLSCQDPHLIAEILSDPRSIPYRSSNSVPTILWDSDTMLTKPLNSEHPPSPLTHYFCSLRTPNDLREPRSHSCLHLSSFHSSPLELWTCFHVLISVFTLPFLIY